MLCNFFGCDLDQAEQSEQWLLELFRPYNLARLLKYMTGYFYC
ncbi:hypothetical protein K661_02561 [Piscirickettsia salmonis LF-89 = ATCC VR-1361]|nr:hypothetical protein K661_02561 [Piscirickettsia salmonis LF-89 = ATCC VR-1361]